METPTSDVRTIHVLVNDRTSTYDETKKRAEAYLYSNFSFADSNNGWPELIVIHGHDHAGFTAEAQADRLWSGLIAAKVIA